MRRWTRGVLSAVLAVCGLSWLPAQSNGNEPLTLKTVAELAVEADSQVASLNRNLRDQMDALGLQGYLDGISLRVSGSLAGNADSSPTVQGSATLSGDLELIPQLILDGKISFSESTAAAAPGLSGPLSGSLGLTLLPLADATGRDRKELAASKTGIDLQAAVNAAAHDATLAFLDVVEAVLGLQQSREEQAIAERVLANTQALHERDRATDSELKNAETAVRSGAQRIVRAELSEKRSRETLSHDLGLPVENLVVPDASDIGLEGYVAKAESILGEVQAADLAPATNSVAKAEHDVKSAKIDADAARRFDPSISVSASAGLPNWQYSVNAEITLSPSNWNATEVSDAQDDLDQATDAYAFAVRLAEYDAQAAIDELRFALDALTYAREDLDDAQVDLNEADFRFGRGGITELQRDQAALAVKQAEYDVIGAQVDVLRRLLELKYSFDVDLE